MLESRDSCLGLSDSGFDSSDSSFETRKQRPCRSLNFSRGSQLDGLC